MAFTKSPLLNAAEDLRVCHSMAQVTADDLGTEGIDYAAKYMEVYNECESWDDLEEEEEIADGF